MNKKTIVLFTLNFLPNKGGIETLLYPIVSHYPEEIIVVTPSQVQCQQFDCNQKFKIKRTPAMGGTILKNIFMMIWSFPIFFKNKISHIQSGNIHSAISSWSLSKIFNIPFSVYAHGMEITALNGNHKSFLYKKFFINILKKSSLVISVNKFISQELLQLGVAPHKIELIPPGVDFVEKNLDQNHSRLFLEEKLGKIITDNMIVILTLARLVKRKGHSQLISALAEVHKTNPSFLYIIGGQGPENNNLREQIKSLGLGDNIFIFNDVSEEDKIDFYLSCDIFAMTNRYLPQNNDIEGFGIVFIEANFYGKPVLGGNNGGVPDAIENNFNGLLVDSENLKEIGQALCQLMKDSELRQQLGQNGRIRAKKLFSSEVASQRVSQALINYYL